MARKKKPDEGSSGAYWMDTYGDMITLVLTFFVLLFSMSTIDAAKWENLVATLTGTPLAVVAPLNPGRSIAPTPDEYEPDVMTPEQKELQEQEDALKEQFQEMIENMMELVKENQLEDVLLLEPSEDMLNIRFVDSILFDSGRADLRPDSSDILLKVSRILQATDNAIALIHIEGHTDNRPINTARFQDNWELSAIRAAKVCNFFLDNTSIAAQSISIAGRGENVPIDTNETEQGRARNRRVDIRIERKVIEVGYDPTPKPPETDESERTQELWDEIL